MDVTEVANLYTAYVKSEHFHSVIRVYRYNVIKLRIFWGEKLFIVGKWLQAIDLKGDWMWDSKVSSNIKKKLKTKNSNFFYVSRERQLITN